MLCKFIKVPLSLMNEIALHQLVCCILFEISHTWIVCHIKKLEKVAKLTLEGHTSLTWHNRWSFRCMARYDGPS